MSDKIRAHVRSNAVGYLALIVALSGTAAATNGSLAGRNTVGSADIINEDLTALDIGPDAVGSSEVSTNSLLASDIFNVDRLEGHGLSLIQDVEGGGPKEIDLLDVGPFTVVGRCTDHGGGSVTAEIYLRGENNVQIDIDTNFGTGGTPPSGPNDLTGVVANTNPVLASFGPTTAEHYGTGTWSAHNPTLAPLLGSLTIGVHVNDDCTFSATAFN